MQNKNKLCKIFEGEEIIMVINEMKWITIYSQKMAGYLMLNGFILQGIGINKNDPSKKTFYFKDSDNLERCMDNFKFNKYIK